MAFFVSDQTGALQTPHSRTATKEDGLDMLFIEYPRCSTCKKARTWLENHDISFTSRDIKSDNPSADELAAWHAASGLDRKRFVNTSGVLYRQMELKDKLPGMNDEELFALLATDGMLVKRPLVIDEERGVYLTGFRQGEWEATLL